MKTKFFAIINFLFIYLNFSLFSQQALIESTSSINWITRDFVSKMSLDTKAANIQLPSGKKKASSIVKTKMPQLIHTPLLSLYSDSNYTLSDEIVRENLSLDEVLDFITNGYKTPDVFTSDAKKLNSTNTTNVNDIGKNLVKHSVSYVPDQPIDFVPTRKFTGIIIDARGLLPIHGEYISEQVNPCFFPQIYDDKMNLIFEKNMVHPEIIKKDGLVSYHYSQDISLYEEKVGVDPLYIKAKKVFGRNRTDPIISREDALKILSEKANIELIKQGKIVILLDKENLIYDISVPEKDENYYVKYNKVKEYFFENKIPVNVVDNIEGIRFEVKLNFYPDSPELLPQEKARIEAIANQLKTLLIDDGYTILVEGHTADVGKPVGQLNLSIERTRTVMNALIGQGIEESLFSYKCYGGTDPIADNDSEEGRAQNRRVYITARPRATYIQRDW